MEEDTTALRGTNKKSDNEKIPNEKKRRNKKRTSKGKNRELERRRVWLWKTIKKIRATTSITVEDKARKMKNRRATAIFFKKFTDMVDIGGVCLKLFKVSIGIFVEITYNV